MAFRDNISYTYLGTLGGVILHLKQIKPKEEARNSYIFFTVWYFST